MATFANAVNPSLRAKLPFNTDKDFAPVALIARSFNIVVVKPNSGINSIADLIAAAKAKPGTLNYGTFGPGTSAHLAGELFKSLAHVKLTAVHYKGAAPAITDLLRRNDPGDVHQVASATSLIKAGQLQALAVTSAKRTSGLSGSADHRRSRRCRLRGRGLVRPVRAGKDPGPRRSICSTRPSVKALMSPAFDKLVANEGLTMVGGTPEQLGQYVQGEEARWGKVVKASHIKIK